MLERTRWHVVVPALVSLTVIGAACGGGGGESANTGAPAPGADGAHAARPGGGQVADAEVAVAGVPSLPQRVVKTASLAVTVKRGTFAQRFQDAMLVASAHGGYVTSTSSGGTDARTATIALRVPASAFELAVRDLRALGTVTSERVSGEDVTAEFVDLQGRLRNWRAQEQVLLRLMDSAGSIDETITVQDELEDVQLSIEEITGQLRVLSNRAELSAVTVALSEAGVGPVRGVERSALSRAWHAAIDGFVAIVSAIVITVGYLLPFALIGALGLLAWIAARRLWRRRARAG